MNNTTQSPTDIKSLTDEQLLQWFTQVSIQHQVGQNTLSIILNEMGIRETNRMKQKPIILPKLKRQGVDTTLPEYQPIFPPTETTGSF